MKKINVLEVNNIDLAGSIFNGYDMISDLSGDVFDIKQVVMIKQSDNDRVVKLLTDKGDSVYYKLMEYENILSTTNVFSITTPALLKLKEYKDADIVHFHMFHNTRISLYSLIKISHEKKVVLTLHDPYFLTGHCVHFYDCNKWKDGCKCCEHLDYLFPYNEDNSSKMWKLKKYVFDNSNIDIVVSSQWMLDLVKASPVFENCKNVHLIPFGISVDKFSGIDTVKAKEHYGLSKEDKVLFLRAQKEFKGTEYVLEALKMLDTDKKISVITCDTKGLLDEIKDKFNIIDLGSIKEDEMKYAMNACDMFLMPSKGESFGMMAVEAMSCSKPVVVFNNTALPSVTFAPRCGYLVKNRDSKDLMKAIKYLIDNPKEAQERGKLGKDICMKEYKKSVYNDRLKSMYLDVFNRKNVNKRFEKVEIVENKDIEYLFSKIKTNEYFDTVPSIDYCNPQIQELIMKYNDELYDSVLNNKIKIGFKERIKNIIKKNNTFYNLLKKILKR